MSSVAPTIFYKVTYERPDANHPLNYLSNRMLRLIEMRKAVRGRVRGEFYIREERVREEFEKIAQNLGAKFTVNPIQDEDMSDIQDLFGSFAPLISTNQQKNVKSEDQKVNSEKNQQELADRDKIIRQLRAELKDKQEMILQLQNQLSQIELLQAEAITKTQTEWQEVLMGFQFYRAIFQLEMESSKTKLDLYEALDTVSTRLGLIDTEALKKMDVALAIAEKNAGIKK